MVSYNLRTVQTVDQWHMLAAASEVAAQYKIEQHATTESANAHQQRQVDAVPNGQVVSAKQMADANPP